MSTEIIDMTAVPSDLLPISDRDITLDWAAKTYEYRCVFNSRFSLTSPTRGDLVSWISEAKDLCKELREYGTFKAEEQIVSLSKHYDSYRTKKTKIQNVYDVVKMMSEDDLYVDNYNLYLDLLHMFQYGIFRCAFNAWAVDAASEWMINRKIKYKTCHSRVVPSEKQVVRKGKGFVYRLLVSRASNTLCVRFQSLTRRVRREYIIVRDRKIKRIENNSNIVRHTFNKHYDGYIIKLDNANDDIADKMIQKNMLIMNQLVKQALKNGTTFETIFKFLNMEIEKGSKGI